MNKCKNCGKKLTGHSNPVRCKSCNQKFLNPKGRQYPHCPDCGVRLKTYHSKRCKFCACKGEKSYIYIDGRTSEKDYSSNYCKNKRKIDINFRISGNLRSRIRIALRGIYKSTSTMNLIGCSVEQLKRHLESQFQLGMTWENYGTGWVGKGMLEWHVDHIIPCISFNLSKPEEQRKCFHYTNLQPLWAGDNLRKNKY